ncbi:glycosyltransferase [Xinfangfangia sp. D13-10-4-6]|uniref:glycosyltransferase n=1 Tax=Pseudogemmobacter hezensis TaxID=2737662 RepID=UPI001555EB00|nr:glycosyltransferase [Pseudogemmobacter hezensis]NPD14410.1 glycosyltransferase [Pseudogemmobacter hezensis]
MDLCLNMIVRDEAGIIAQTLSNLLDHVQISTWVIHDTGSRDGTPEVIRAFFAARQIPGELIHREWENFGANRQYALEDAKGRAAFALFFDADDGFEGQLPALPVDCDSLTLNMTRGAVTYPTKLIVRNDGRYRWRGVVHEGLYFNPGPDHPHEKVAHVAGDYRVISRCAGARSRDNTTFLRDANTLARAVASLPAEDADLLPRYCFYCANSWRDAGAPHEAAHWYRKRIGLGGWKDEVFLSWLGLGIELRKTGDTEGAIRAFMQGHEVCPDRNECLFHLVQALRLAGQVEMALLLAREGLRIPKPGGMRLFLWHDVYAWWMDFEFLMCLKTLNHQAGTESEEALARMRAAGAPAHLFPLVGA